MTDSSTVEGAESAEVATDVNAESSTAVEDKANGSLEDAVSAALGQDEPEATPAPDEQGSKEPATDSAEGEASEEDDSEEEISEEDIKRTSERTQRRIRELVEQRKTAEARATETEQELESLKPKAAQMDQLTGYMRERNILPEHLDNALGLTAMINGGDYEKALPVLESLLAQVRNAAGETLPNDLQQQVGLGYITEAHAKELHKARLGKEQAEGKAQEAQQRAAAERSQRETQDMVKTVVQTAEAWNQEQATTDPDWNLKRDRVVDAMELELRRLGPEGYPRTDKAARELLGKIKQKVEAGIKQFQPKPKAIDPSPTGGNASPRSKAKPASVMDAIDQALSASE